jgi:hypothetical protein
LVCKRPDSKTLQTASQPSPGSYAGTSLIGTLFRRWLIALDGSLLLQKHPALMGLRDTWVA